MGHFQKIAQISLVIKVDQVEETDKIFSSFNDNLEFIFQFYYYQNSNKYYHKNLIKLQNLQLM